MNKEQLIDAVAKRADMRNTHRDATGELVCNTCGEPRTAFIDWNTGYMPVPCACMLKASRDAAHKAETDEAERLRRESPLNLRGLDGCTFAADDSPDGEASRLCRDYVAHWAEMEKNGLGFILSGSLGTGKSYLAACVVNALTAQGITAIMTSSARFVACVQAAKAPAEVHDALNRFRLVVLDDVGAERSTDYAAEQIESFVDARMLLKRPLIVTTNIGGKDLAEVSGTKYARTFDRLKLACPKLVTMNGKSRRGEQRAERAALMERILRGE